MTRWKDDPLGIVPETKIWPYYPMVYTWDIKLSGILEYLRSQIQITKSRQMKTCRLVDFAIPADRWNDKKYLDLARELKGDVDNNCSLCICDSPQGLGKEIEISGRMEIIHTAALL